MPTYGQFTPAVIAGGTIGRNRCIIASGVADNTGLQAGAAAADIIGVSQGASRNYTDDDAAEAGEQVQLQMGRIWRVEAGAAVTAGDRLATDADGKVVTAVATNPVVGVALEASSADGDLIRVRADNSSVA